MNHTTGVPGKRGHSRRLRFWKALDRPGIRGIGQELLCGVLALVLSTAATGSLPLPLYLGFLLSLDGDRGALAGAIGCSISAALFWQEQAFIQLLAGTVAGLFAIALFSGTKLRKELWFSVVLAAGITGAMGLTFLLAGTSLTTKDLWNCLVQTVAAAGAAWAFGSLSRQRTRLMEAAGAGMLCLALCQMLVFDILDVGIAAGAFFVCMTGDLNTALLCGLGIDLARITAVPVTPILALSILTAGKRNSLLPRLAPAIWAFPLMYIAEVFDPVVPLGLFVGCLLALPLPKKRMLPTDPGTPEAPDTGARLEIAAEALGYIGDILEGRERETEEEDFIPERVASRVCNGCSRKGQCDDLLCQAIPALLEKAVLSPGDIPRELREHCPRTKELAQAMTAALRDLRVRRQYRFRRREEETALCRQYRSLSDYLRRTAGELERPLRASVTRYRVELGTAAMGKFGLQASGDKGAHFHGPGNRYYVILCDGMGSGLGAARESESALKVLTGMLQAGLPPETAMETLNDLYVLRETGGFSTVDLLELHLDTGKAQLYKWGAAPSYLKYRATARAMGTAAPPPGISVASGHGPEKLGFPMQRGEILVLVSDGLVSDELKGRIASLPGHDPKALAEALLEGTGHMQDDCTAVAVRLTPLMAK